MQALGFSGEENEEPHMTLFRSQGARWKRLRTISSPTFAIGSIKKVGQHYFQVMRIIQMRPIVEDSALRLVEIMEQRHSNGAIFDIAPSV